MRPVYGGFGTVEVNDNDAVARLYNDARQIATDLRLAFVFLHHERKPQLGQTRDSSQAMLGARHWAGQADTHLTLTVAGPLTEEPAESGHRRLRRTFTLRMPDQDHRSGQEGRPLMRRRCLDCRRLIASGSRCPVCQAQAVARYSTAEYRAARAEVRERAGYACERCGSRNGTQAHHTTKVRTDPSTANVANPGRLVLLCLRRHREAERDAA